MPTPVNVFTGFLGAGKSTCILNLIQQLNERALVQNSNIVWLKNEFGENAVDSVLAKEKSIAVKEILNGCLCCTLVGKLSDAIKEIVETMHPDRIIIETSGSAYPAPVAWEIRRLSEEGIPVKLDSIVCVIDAINFKGYEDKSPTAKLQAQYTDIILINKHEEISERELDAVLDDVFEMNPETPKLKTKKGFINADIVVGLDTNLFLAKGNADLHSYDHHDEAKEEVQILDVLLPPVNNTFELIVAFLNKMGEQKDVFFRIKGVVFLEPEEAGLGEKEFTASKSYLGMVEVKTKSAILVNWAFGRYDIVPLASEASILAHDNQHGESKISIMGLRIHDTHNINYIANALTIDKKHVKKLVGSQQHSHDSPNSHL